MLIILEGPDGAGKTTLARDVADYIGLNAKVDLLHAGPATQHPLDEYELPLLDYRPDTTHLVCDRWHLGEAVYPAVLNRETRWDDAVARHVHMFLQSRGACTILLKPSRGELETRLKARGDNLIGLEQLHDVVYGYTRLPSHFFTHRYGNGLDKTVPTPRAIVNMARRLHLAASALRPFETYVGPPKPRVLVLGDVRGPGPRTSRPGLPAFMPYPSTSGHYLLSHLDTRGFGLANACDEDDPYELWLKLGEPHVVTLGRNATQRLDELKMPHGSAPHPQYIRRFHNKAGDRYGHIIRHAAYTGEDMSSWRPS